MLCCNAIALGFLASQWTTISHKGPKMSHTSHTSTTDVVWLFLYLDHWTSVPVRPIRWGGRFSWSPTITPHHDHGCLSMVVWKPPNKYAIESPLAGGTYHTWRLFSHLSNTTSATAITAFRNNTIMGSSLSESQVSQSCPGSSGFGSRVSFVLPCLASLFLVFWSFIL